MGSKNGLLDQKYVGIMWFFSTEEWIGLAAVTPNGFRPEDVLMATGATNGLHYIVDGVDLYFIAESELKRVGRCRQATADEMLVAKTFHTKAA